MSVETTLFILRLISGLCLFGLLGALFYLLWREYQGTLSQLQASRRVYGHLVSLQEVDGAYVVMGTPYPLLPLTSLGRSPTNSIVVDDTFASGEHALIALRNGQWWLEDRHSRNGTTLNDTPVNEAVIMTNGDIIGIGNNRFRLDLEQI